MQFGTEIMNNPSFLRILLISDSACLYSNMCSITSSAIIVSNDLSLNGNFIFKSHFVSLFIPLFFVLIKFSFIMSAP